MALTIWLDYEEQARTNPSMIMRQWYWRLFYLIVALTFGITVCYSRMYLGVHSLNQVVFGASMGIYSAFTAHFYLKDPMFKHIQNLIDNEQVQGKLAGFFWSSFALLLVSLTIQIINYEVVLEFDNPQSWSDNIIQQCGEDALEDAYQSKSLSDFGSCVGLWGAYWGILTQISCSPGIISGSTPTEEKWYIKLARVGMAVVVSLPGLLFGWILLR